MVNGCHRSRGISRGELPAPFMYQEGLTFKGVAWLTEAIRHVG